MPADDGDDEKALVEPCGNLGDAGRDMAEGMDVDILNEDGTDLTAPAKVIFGAVSLVTAFIGVSLALIVGDGPGALLGQWLGGGSGGAPPGFYHPANTPVRFRGSCEFDARLLLDGAVARGRRATSRLRRRRFARLADVVLARGVGAEMAKQPNDLRRSGAPRQFFPVISRRRRGRAGSVER